MSIEKGQTISGLTVDQVKLWNNGYSAQTIELTRTDDDAVINVSIWQDLPGEAVFISAARRVASRYGIDPDIPTMNLISEEQLAEIITAFQQLPGYFPGSVFCIYDVEHTFIDRNAKETTFSSDRKPSGSSGKSVSHTLVSDRKVTFTLDLNDGDWRAQRTLIKEFLAEMTPESARLPGIRILAHVPGQWQEPYNFQRDLFPAGSYWVKDPQHGGIPQWYTGALIYIERLAGETTPQLQKRVEEIELHARLLFDANPGMSQRQLQLLLQKLTKKSRPSTHEQDDEFAPFADYGDSLIMYRGHVIGRRKN